VEGRGVADQAGMLIDESRDADDADEGDDQARDQEPRPRASEHGALYRAQRAGLRAHGSGLGVQGAFRRLATPSREP